MKQVVLAVTEPFALLSLTLHLFYLRPETNDNDYLRRLRLETYR
jgi:hypothetical protein